MVMTAATLWAVNGTVSKVILTTGLSSLRLAEVRSTGAFVLLALALALSRPEALRIRRGEVPYFILFGAGGLALVQWFYFLAIHRLPIGIALLIQYIAPVLVALWARYVLHEAVRRRIWLALLLALTGLALVVEIWSGVSLDAAGGRRLARSSRLVRALHPAGGAPDRRARPDLARLPRLSVRIGPLGGRPAVVELSRPPRRRGRLAARPSLLAAPAGLVSDGLDDPAGHNCPIRAPRRSAAPHHSDAGGNRGHARARCGRDRRVGLARRIAWRSAAGRRSDRAGSDFSRTERSLMLIV